MHTIKITPNLLFEYQCTRGKFIRLPNRIEKIDSVARIESNRNFFCPNWNALAAISRQLSRCASSARRIARQLVCSVAQRRRRDVAATSATDADVLPTSTTSARRHCVYWAYMGCARSPSQGKGNLGVVPSLKCMQQSSQQHGRLNSQ